MQSKFTTTSFYYREQFDFIDEKISKLKSMFLVIDYKDYVDSDDEFEKAINEIDNLICLYSK